jgi:RNA polymerase sigma factor (sigma-70 family)
VADELLQNLDLLLNAGPVAGLSDAQLLARFVARHGESSEIAFAAIVARHGAMVLGVCRHVLRDPHEVSDAFQATFVVLVRRAWSVRVSDSLAPWLYCVAYRVATRARSKLNRRRGRETDSVDSLTAPPSRDAERDELLRLLHEELNRLPEKYRAPVVLCHLEGRTHEEAARLLRCPVGTVSGRLSRARDLLRSRLSRRGITAPVGVIPMIQDAAGVLPDALGAARGIVSHRVDHLARGVLTAMRWNTVKTWLVGASAVGLMALGAGYVAGQAPRPKGPQNKTPSPDVQAQTKVDEAQSTRSPSPDRAPGSAPSPFAVGFPKAFERSKQLVDKPNDPNDVIPALTNESIILVTAPDGRTLSAMSLAQNRHFNPAKRGEWASYKVPEGVDHFIPIMSKDVVAMALAGPRVRELVAFSPYEEPTWLTQPLSEPVNDEIVPTIGHGAALYQIGNDFYAFSAAAMRWGVLHLPGKTKPRYGVRPEAILVQQGELLFVFNTKFGTWSEGVAVKLPDRKK